MSIILIEDDLVESKKLLPRLRRGPFMVRHCRSIKQVKNGWFELNDKEFSLLKTQNIPRSVIISLYGIYGTSFLTEDDFLKGVKHLLDKENYHAHIDSIKSYAKQTFLDEEIDLILLDLAMPVDGFYSKTESANGTMTGLCLLNDIKDSIEGIPVIVISIMADQKIKSQIYKLYPNIVRKVIQKPTLPSHVTQIISKHIN